MSEGVFTTWADLRQQILNDLANGAFRRLQSYSVASGGTGGSRSVTYKGLAELRATLEWVEAQALEEKYGGVGRVSMANGGRG
jgi:hypothetical protein